MQCCRDVCFPEFTASSTCWVESGLDDPDYLGHFLGGSSGSHPQTELSGCDLNF